MNQWRTGSRLVVLRCGDSARMRAAWPWRPVRRAVLRASAWLELAGGLGEVDERGTAVLCLEPPRLRDAGRFVAVMAAVMVVAFAVAVVLAEVSEPAFVAYGAVLAAICGWTFSNQWRDRVVRRRLNQARPAGGWNLHNFVRHPDHPGAGRALLERVVSRADAEGRTLYLDTVVPRLVEYYREFGFEVAAAVPGTYAGEDVVVTRMVRLPRPVGGSGPDDV